MALNTCEMWSNGDEAFFSKKLQKIAQRLGASPPDPNSLRRLGVPPPDPRQWYVWSTVHFFTQHVCQFRHFQILTFGLILPFKRVPSYVPTPGYGFWSSILRYLCSHKNSCFEVSDDVIACNLRFGPPQSKILATPMPHSHQRLGAPPLGYRLWYVWVVEYTSLLNASPKLDICIF